MDSQELIERRFADIGADVSIGDLRPRLGMLMSRMPTMTVDIRDGRFDIRHAPDVEVKVLDVRPKEKHLVLYVSDGRRFLCGHDERDWFVAAVPDAITTVQQARDSLKPPDVRTREKGLKRRKRNRRHNAGSIRQGEWFFTPEPDFELPDDTVLHSEPIARMRGGRVAGTPHVCEDLVRVGGWPVYQLVRNFGWRDRPEFQSVRADLPNHALTGAERSKFLKRHPDLNDDKFWRVWTAGMEVYARGAVRHPDHATVVLKGWHRVHGNTEDGAPGHAAVLFVD